MGAAVFAGLAAVPVIGGPAVEIAAGTLTARQMGRQHEFNMAVAAALQSAVERLDGLTPASIVESDEFMAAYQRASHAAAESASADKRARLAAALRHAGPWSSVQELRRTQLLDFVVRFRDLHFAMLQFFSDSHEWLRANVPDWDEPRASGTSSIEALLGEHCLPEVDGWLGTVSPVFAELQTAGLLDNAPLFSPP